MAKSGRSSGWLFRVNSVTLPMNMKGKKRVLLTGATGVMGRASMKEIASRPDLYSLTVFVRDSKKNRRILAPWLAKGVEVCWGDLNDPSAIGNAVKNADIVLHVGGMVSPAADWHPRLTVKTNVGAMRNIVDAARTMDFPPAIVYIGSVAQYGHRDVPNHWGGAGDPLLPALYDAYAYSKTEAERILAESGLPLWVSLRQTGILHSGLLMKASDPITFHVPVEGVLEWATARDSGRLMERVCREEVPDDFWKHFYNIGGGAAYRLTNYEFESRLLAAMGCPPPEKVFEARWFATGNFHGFWFDDSDRLEEILHFRAGDTPEEYFAMMKKELPWYFSLAPLAPAPVIKSVMKRVAHTPRLGPMWWVREGKEGRIKAAFGSKEAWAALPGWNGFNLSRPDDKLPPHKEQPYDWSVVKDVASSRKGSLISVDDAPLEPDTLLTLECSEGHTFNLRARTLLEGGHWCPSCMLKRAMMDEEE